MADLFNQSRFDEYKDLLHEARSRLIESQEQLQSARGSKTITFEQKLKRIDDALKRIGDNNYGICLACEEPIEEQRLRNLPYAEYCFPCQQRREKTKLSP